jgi:hypothetical protein
MAFLEVAGGVVLGALLTAGAERLARREEREHVRRERVRERQREAVEKLADALDAAHAKLPVFTGKQIGGEELWAAQGCWQDGFFRSAQLVGDAELLVRYDAVGWVLLTCALDAQRGVSVDTWAAIRAINNARSACAAFILEEPLPPRTFPPRPEAASMVHTTPAGRDWQPLYEWLTEHSDD